MPTISLADTCEAEKAAAAATTQLAVTTGAVNPTNGAVNPVPVGAKSTNPARVVPSRTMASIPLVNTWVVKIPVVALATWVAIVHFNR